MEINQKYIFLYPRIILMVQLLFIILSSKNTRTLCQDSQNEIILKMKGPNKKYLLGEQNSDGYFFQGEYPEKIIINNKVYKENIYNITIELDLDINNITMIWNINYIIFSFMFSNCQNLLEVDLSHFNISGGGFKLDKMFSNCKSLTSVKFFDNINNYINLNYMFSGCTSLSYLNIPNITISSTRNVDMTYMFLNCTSLTFVNISNILNYSSGDVIMNYMFSRCTSLTYVNISNILINSNGDVEMTYMFSGCNSLNYVSISNIQNHSNGEINMYNMLSYSFSLNYVSISNIQNHSNGDITMSYMLSCCIYLNQVSLSYIKNHMNGDITMSYMFSGCNSLNNVSMSNITNYGTGDITKDNMFSNETLCINIFEENIISNTVEEVNSYISENIKNKESIYLDKEVTNINNINLIQEETSNDIKNKILSENFDLNSIKNGTDLIIEEEEKGIKYILTSLENQNKNIENDNMTIVNLGDCEKELRKKYGISGDIFMLKVEKEQEGFKIPKIEYELFAVLNSGKRVQLNLDICEGLNACIYIPINKSENECEKNDLNGGFYHNICYAYSVNNSVDVPLISRKTEFIENNWTLCEENCEFERCDYVIGKAICSCMIKIKMPLISEISFDKNIIINKFKNFKSVANINILKCYYLIFNKKYFTKNIGFITFCPVIIFYIISAFIFFFKDIKKIHKIIHDIKVNKKDKGNKKKKKQK